MKVPESVNLEKLEKKDKLITIKSIDEAEDHDKKVVLEPFLN